MRNLLFLYLFLLVLTACSQKRDLTTCVDAGPDGARMRCDGNRLLYCNAGTGFAFRQTTGCSAGQTCYVSKDEMSGGCK